MPEMTNLLSLCKIFNTTPNELFGYEAPVPQPEPIKRKKPVFLIVLLILSIVLNILLISAVGLYVWYAYDEQVNAVVQPQDIPESFGFEDISYRILEVSEDENTLEISFRPTTTKDGYVYGVAVKGNLASDIFYGNLGEDGLVTTTIVVERYSLLGGISLFASSEGVNVTMAAYSYGFSEDADTYSVYMKEEFK